MKRVLLNGVLAIFVAGSCSIDAEQLVKDRLANPEVSTSEICYACKDQAGFELEICNNMDDTYTLFYKGVEVKTIQAAEMEDKTARDFAAEGCKGIPDFGS